ncbi:hypothetical protein B0J11DRAFT_596165 [Dendryphion nanum]|uniref:Uncharacterized protein n=1 Tax=Dendryphion nanum TaxID=256645 RepID=A0A9P9EDN0_9PLEO|nr:hypothetical protein B0J11DRAFT_596165 [Dendryphion nanum]
MENQLSPSLLSGCTESPRTHKETELPTDLTTHVDWSTCALPIAVVINDESDASTVIASSASPKCDPAHFRTKLELLKSQKEMIDLGWQVKKLMREKEKLAIKISELQANMNANDSHTNTLILQHGLERARLLKENNALESMNAIQAMELDTIRSQRDLNAELVTTNTKLVDLNTSLNSKLNQNVTEMNVLAGERQELHMIKKHTVEERDRLNADNVQLKNENKQLVRDRTKNAKEMESVLMRNDNLKAKMEPLQSQIATLTADRDRYKAQHLAMIAEKNKKNSERAINQEELIRLKAEIQTLKHSLCSIKKAIAGAVTDLDLMAWDEEIRVYVCQHQSLSNLFDCKNDTRVKCETDVAEFLFRRLACDQVFIEAYQNVRKNLVNHHKAHETQKPGRGDHTSIVIECLFDTDQCRGLNITY